MKLNNRLIVFTVVLVLITTISKLLFAAKIEWSGFSPVIGIALFSGMMVKNKSNSFLYPLVALLVSDVVIEILHRAGYFAFEGLYKYQFLNYAFLMISVLVGWVLKGRKYSSIAAGSFAAPTFFFLISNFTVWNSAVQTLYPKTANGLLLCYEAGLPFYKNSLIATFIFVPLIIAAYNFIVKRYYNIKLA